MIKVTFSISELAFFLIEAQFTAYDQVRLLCFN